jgi:hypothetical protein
VKEVTLLLPGLLCCHQPPLFSLKEIQGWYLTEVHKKPTFALPDAVPVKAKLEWASKDPSPLCPVKC